MNSGFDYLETQVSGLIKDQLDRLGMHYRLFSRAKTIDSVREKIKRKEAEGDPYTEGGKKMQDIIGVRVVTYFKDDVNLLKSLLSKKIDFLDSEDDEVEPTVFKPKRTNFICSYTFKNGQDLAPTFSETVAASNYEEYKLLDSTFELQLRTVLSEGWHEVDHSLRYKCKGDWDDYAESERWLNGIYASLESNDIALKSLFHDLCFKHFKNKNWEAFLRNKFLLKLQQDSLDDQIKVVFDGHPEIPKELFKLSRAEALEALVESNFDLPVNFNNLVYTVNHLIMKDARLSAVTPETVKEMLDT